MIANALSGCPEIDTMSIYLYPQLVNTTKRSQTDQRCRCAIYQEMIELFQAYFVLNKRSHSFAKVPIKVEHFSRTVKLSVLAVEFRDKLL